jgi:radical SAM protein with 4Fe4S-binding SPASM domain
MRKYTFNTIFYEATRRCNLSCALCMSSSNNRERVRESVKKELTTTEIEKHILATAHEIGVKVMTWSGGEFILRKDALQLVRLATEHGYESSICTNGVSMTEEKLKRFDEAAGGSLVVAVGINSIENENAWTRDAECGVALKVLDLCRKLGIKRHCVVNIGKHNLKTIAKTLQWLEEKGIPYNRSPFTARGSGCGHFKDLGFTREEMEKVIHPELRKHPSGYISYTPFFLSPELHEHFSKGHKNVTVPQSPSIGCFCGTWLGISAEGNVSPCGILMDVLDCGNVREKTLRQIIDGSPVFQTVLDRSKLKGKCGRCRYQYVCGGCRAMAFFHKGDVMEEDPTCFFDPRDRSEKSPHEDETNKMFKRYVFMVRHAGRNMVRRKQAPAPKA